MSYTPKNLGHLVMRVRDLDRSVDFYTRIMGLTIMEKTASGTVFMSADTEKSHELAIRAIGMDAGGPDHSIVGQAHMAWQMETFEDLQELYDRIKENEVRIVRMGDHGVSMGVYLLDPDDNEIEVYYEMPKEQWERHPERVCSATSTRASLRSELRWLATSRNQSGFIKNGDRNRHRGGEIFRPGLVAQGFGVGARL